VFCDETGEDKKMSNLGSIRNQKRVLAVILTVIMLFVAVMPQFVMADSSNGGGVFCRPLGK
jgi:hypothetical protein